MTGKVWQEVKPVGLSSHLMTDWQNTMTLQSKTVGAAGNLVYSNTTSAHGTYMVQIIKKKKKTRLLKIQAYLKESLYFQNNASFDRMSVTA